MHMFPHTYVMSFTHRIHNHNALNVSKRIILIDKVFQYGRIHAQCCIWPDISASIAYLHIEILFRPFLSLCMRCQSKKIISLTVNLSLYFSLSLLFSLALMTNPTSILWLFGDGGRCFGKQKRLREKLSSFYKFMIWIIKSPKLWQILNEIYEYH